MDTLLLLKALLLGLLEGATEFLPISSTGHLIIAADLLNFTGETAKTFEIVIQLGAVLAIVYHYRHKIAQVLHGMRSGDPVARRFVSNLAIAFVPAAVIGLLLNKYIKEYLFSPITVAFALIVGGFVILLVERMKPRVQVEHVDDMNWRYALKVGLAQSFALFPGVSRSGATIMGGLVAGLSRPAATEFSFFLSIPTMFAATGYDMLKHIHMLKASDLLVFAVGFIAAFLAGLVAVKALLNYISRHNFKIFAYYRIIFGALVLFYFWH